MPHLDIIDSIEEKRGAILRLVRVFAGDDENTGPLSHVVNDALSDIAEHIDDERREWEAALSMITDADSDYEDWLI